MTLISKESLRSRLLKLIRQRQKNEFFQLLLTRLVSSDVLNDGIEDFKSRWERIDYSRKLGKIDDQQVLFALLTLFRDFENEHLNMAEIAEEPSVQMTSQVSDDKSVTRQAG